MSGFNELAAQRIEHSERLLARWKGMGCQTFKEAGRDEDADLVFLDGIEVARMPYPKRGPILIDDEIEAALDAHMCAREESRR